MKTSVLTLLIALVVLLCSCATRADEPLPKADDPLALRMQGSWKGTFTSSVGGTTKVYVLYRIQRNGVWQQTMIDPAGKIISQEGGTYVPPEERGSFLTPQDVRFSVKGRRDTIEKIRILQIERMDIGIDGPKSKPITYQRITDAEVPVAARLREH